MAHLPDTARLASADLKVRDLESVAAFYTDIVGLARADVSPRGAALVDPASGDTVLQLQHDPAADLPRRAHAGLFHLAFLYEDRASLAAAIRRVFDRGVRAHGFQDHGVSEAFYLADPEGNGVELYVDRPREQWPRNGDRFAMYSDPIAMQAWLDQVASVTGTATDAVALGHVHLRVSSLDASEAFYTRQIGLDVTQDDYPGARFMAFGGYHHHVAVNTWSGEGIPPRPESTTGLVAFHFTGAGSDVPSSLTDPDNIALTFAA